MNRFVQVLKADRLPKPLRLMRLWGAWAIQLARFSKDLVANRNILNNISGIPLEIIKLPEYRNVFCGYYDVSPFRPGIPSQIALHCARFPAWLRPSIKRKVDLVLYDRCDQTYTVLETSSAWNWQQGSRIQWIDKDHLIYNIYDRGVVGVLRNVVTNTLQRLPINVSIAFKDQYLLSIGYAALTKGSEYGYPGMDTRSSISAVQRYQFDNGQLDEVFSQEEISDLVDVKVGMQSHVNHLLPSPTGTRFVFIYRTYLDGRRLDSLIVYDFESGRLRVLVRHETISHYAWRDERSLLVWCVIGGAAGYYLCDTEDGTLRLQIGCADGHPNFLSQDCFISDICRSWRNGVLTLYIADLTSGCTEDLLEMGHPVVFRKTNRCDMHVSLTDDKSQFQIDSRYSGGRVVIIGDLSTLVH